MFSLCDLRSVLCSRDLDVLRAQRLIGFLILITHKSTRSGNTITWLTNCSLISYHVLHDGVIESAEQLVDNGWNVRYLTFLPYKIKQQKAGNKIVITRNINLCCHSFPKPVKIWFCAIQYRCVFVLVIWTFLRKFDNIYIYTCVVRLYIFTSRAVI